MKIPHLLTALGLTATALIGFAAASQSESTSQAATTTLELNVRDAPGVPDDATAAVLNIAAARAAAPGFASAWPCDQPRPTASVLNFRPGAAESNSTVVSLSDEGTVCVSRSTDVDLIVDVNSVFRAGGSFVGQNPERLLDTREGGAAQAGEQISVTVAGRGAVPAGATAAAVTITAARASAGGFIVAWPCGEQKPDTAALNFRPGPARANSTTVGLGADGELCLESTAATDVIVDVNGSFTSTDVRPFVPQRLVDTRLTGRPSPGTVMQVDVGGRGGVSGDAAAAALNITAARPSGVGFLQAWPCGSGRPDSATVNYSDQPVSNSTIVGLGSDGTVCMSTSNATDLVIDVNAGFPTDSGVVSFKPARIIDTRSTSGPSQGGGPASSDGESSSSDAGSSSSGGGNSSSGGGPTPTGAFVETFDGNRGLERFDRGVWHRDDSVVATTSWTGDHDRNCGTPASQRPIQRNRPDDVFYTCRDHLMTSVGDTSGYSIAWFSPKQVFNGQSEVSVDVNSTNLGLRQWWEVSMVPADYDSGVADCELCIAGASAISTFFPTQPSNTFVFGLQGGGQRVMVDYENAPRSTPKLCNDAGPIDPEGCDSKPIRRTWTATDNGDGTVTVRVLDEVITMPGSFPDGDWRLVVKDHNYTPTKDGFRPVGFTWHWDNVIVS